MLLLLYYSYFQVSPTLCIFRIIGIYLYNNRKNRLAVVIILSISGAASCYSGFHDMLLNVLTPDVLHTKIVLLVGTKLHKSLPRDKIAE